MIISFDNLLKRLEQDAVATDTSPNEALWVRFDEQKTTQTVEYRTPNEGIVHIYLNEGGAVVGIEMFP